MNELYDIQTVEVMKRVLEPTSNCIDVGCHKGDILRAILSIAPDGSHYAFEPIPALFQELQTVFPAVRLFNIALSDVEGEASFQHVTSNPGYSGLRQRRYDRESEVIEQIPIKTARLDAILPEEFRVDFLKIDVEGAELQVLQGGLKTISINRPLIVLEHGYGAADCYGTHPAMVYDLLTGDCGLAVSLMADWLAGNGPLSRQEFVRQFDTGENYYFMGHRPSCVDARSL